MPKTCHVCQKELKGRQRRFCSIMCKTAFWNGYNREMKLGEVVPYVPEEIIQAFLKDYFNVMRTHAEAINKIINRNREKETARRKGQNSRLTIQPEPCQHETVETARGNYPRQTGVKK